MLRKYDYWWSCVQSANTIQLKRIANEVGSTKQLYDMSAERLAEISGVSERLAGIIDSHRRTFNIDKEYETLLKSDIRFITWYDEDYPDSLREISGSPFAIFCKGRLPDMNRKSVAIIGARDCSEYGRMLAARLGNDLARYGVQIISGMAYGIDGISQMAALDAGGDSYGVLGSGVDICYPASNRRLYSRLIDNGGLISEYAPGTKAVAKHFPLRNRIISALSDMVIVVEAREKSGTMITVDMALEQGKDVAVVPGRVTDPLSSGCIKLMKQGAMVITDAEDAMYILDDGFDNSRLRGKNKLSDIELGAEERKIYDCLDWYCKNLSRICEEVKMPVSLVIKLLVELQIKGIVTEVGKGNYVKKS